MNHYQLTCVERYLLQCLAEGNQLGPTEKQLLSDLITEQATLMTKQAKQATPYNTEFMCNMLLEMLLDMLLVLVLLLAAASCLCL